MDQKYIIDDKDLPKMLKNKENELYFLQKKRKLKNLEINNNDFIFQKDNNFSILNGKKIEVNINQQNEIENGQQIIETPFINFG